MSDSENAQQRKHLSSMLDAIRQKAHQVKIWVIANVKGVTQSDDYAKHSVTTDYLSISELEEIIVAFRQFGFYVETFTDEMDFIDTVVRHHPTDYLAKKIIVYNLSQKGIGASRHATIPSFCKLYKIPFIGSDGYASSVCRHKFHFNSILKNFHPHVPKMWLYKYPDGWLRNDAPPKGLKVIVKPVYEAASIGIDHDSVFYYSENKDNYIATQAKNFSQPLAVEEFISGYEAEIPLIIDQIPIPLGPIGISMNNIKDLDDKFLSYDLIYNDAYSFYCYSDLDEDTSARMKNCAILSSQVLGIEDFGRIDFRIDKKGNFYLTDITTGPHTTIHSSYSYALKTLGFSHSDAISMLAALTIHRLGITL